MMAIDFTLQHAKRIVTAIQHELDTAITRPAVESHLDYICSEACRCLNALSSAQGSKDSQRIFSEFKEDASMLLGTGSFQGSLYYLEKGKEVMSVVYQAHRSWLQE